MRRSFLLIGLVGLLLSCQREYQRELNDVALLINDRPDSALSILSSIEIEQISSKRDKARYALLVSMAKDKNYIDTPNDSLINIAINYYSRHGEIASRMKAWYYHGLVKINANEYATAAVSLEKAEYYAEKLNDLHYIGLINRNKARVFNATNNYENAILYCKKALSAFESNHDTLYAEHIKYSLAIDYINNRDYTNARLILKEILTSSDQPILVSKSYLRYAMTLAAKRDSLDVALGIYRSIPKSSFNYMDYGYYAYTLSALGQKDSASYWIEKGYRFAKGRLSTATLESLFAHIDALNGKYEDAYNKLSNASNVQDSLTKKLLQQSLSNAQRDYYHQEMTIQEGIVEKQRVIYITGSVIALLLLVITALYLWNRRKQEETKLKEQMASLVLLQQSAQVGNRSLVGAWFLEKMARLSGLSHLYYSSEALFEKEEVLGHFKKTVKELQKSPEWFIELRDNLNRYCSNVMEKMEVQVPSVKGENKTLAALFFAGVPDSVIQLLMGRISASSLRTFRSRLRKEIKATNPPDEKLFLDMLTNGKRTQLDKPSTKIS